jgi:type II secretory pathway component GspD/PulD (secretin)
MSSRFLPAALILAGLVAPAVAQEPSGPQRCSWSAKDKLVTKDYQVADLVIPVDRETQCIVVGPKKAEIVVGPKKAEKAAAEKPSATSGPTPEEVLVKLITNAVSPRSWSAMGGPGTIQYFPLTMSLVIQQTPDVQDQIADLLAALRRLQDQEVSVEIRIVSVAESLFCKCIAAVPESPLLDERSLKAEGIVLDDSQLFHLMEVLQSEDRTNILQTPKLTVFNHQRATLRVGDDKSFVTDVKVRHRERDTILVPKTQTFFSGLELSLQPAIAADRRSVRVDLQALLQEVETSVFPLVVPLVPPGESEEKAVGFTQYLQKPHVQALAVEKSFSVPDGHTMVVDGGKRTRTARNEYGPPVLSDLPLLGRLFCTVGYGKQTEHVLLLVTPRIIVPKEEEPKKQVSNKAAAKSPKDLVGEAMRQFNAAYREGNYQEAEKWALMAHELDPDNSVGAAALKMARLQQRGMQRMEGTSPCTTEESAVSPPPATKSGAKMVAALLAKYRKACAAGRLDEARKLAGIALTIDPACFCKPQP